jgi:uncharacterized protein (TIGR00369 family)
MTQMTVAELNHFLDEHFPQADHYGEVVSINDKTALMRMDITDAHLRPGGTVSGPTLMAMADLAMYVVILAQIGPVALAVTTNLNINFLRKPAAGKAVTAEANLLKLGKRLAVGEVSLFSEGEEDPVAHVTCTYSIPPR